MNNKKIFVQLLLMLIINSLLCSADSVLVGSKFKEGDIIFHISKSDQSRAIQIATRSKYSHMGIIFKINNKWVVLEAVQPVKFTPVNEWINRGVKSHYVLKRLKRRNEILSEDIIRKMKQAGTGYVEKDYDSYFEWSDKKLYCSELVWKLYERVAGIEIGKLKNLKDFDLSHPTVRQKLKERFGNRIPLNEKVISPADMFDSKELKEISN